MVKYIYVFLTIILTVYGQIVIKARALSHAPGAESARFILAMFMDPWVWSGLLSAFAASAAWMMAVRHADLSLIYPIMALTFVLVPVLATVVFGEKLGTVQMAGIALIVIGVALSALHA